MTFYVFWITTNPSTFITVSNVTSLEETTYDNTSQDWVAVSADFGNLPFSLKTKRIITFPLLSRLSLQGKLESIDLLVKEGDFVKENQHIASIYGISPFPGKKIFSIKDKYTKLLAIILQHEESQKILVDNIRTIRNKITDAEDSLAALMEESIQLSNGIDKNALISLEDQIKSLHYEIDITKSTLLQLENQAALVDSQYNQTADSFSQEYKASFTKWLGVRLENEQTFMSPDSILASWDTNLASIFSKAIALHKSNTLLVSDDPHTPWNETMVNFWSVKTPNALTTLCADFGNIPLDKCLDKLLAEEWEQISLLMIQTSQQRAAITDKLAKTHGHLFSLELEHLSKTNELVLLRKVISNEDLTSLEQNMTLSQERIKNLQSMLGQLSIENNTISLVLQKNISGADILSKVLKEISQSSRVAQLRSPISGIIQHIQEPTPDNKTTSLSLCILDTSNLAIQFSLPTHYFNQTSYRPTATIEFPPQKQDVIGQVNISSINRAHKSNQPLGPTCYPSQLLQHSLSPIRSENILAYVRIIGEQRNVVIIPSQALHTEGVSQYVYILDSNNVEKRYVDTGLNNKQHTAITSGILEGELVIMNI